MEYMIEIKNIIFYNGYVYDILIISEYIKMTAEEIFHKMNSSYFKLEFKDTYLFTYLLIYPMKQSPS